MFIYLTAFILCISFSHSLAGVWTPVGSNICYGAKGNSFGIFKLPVDGFVTALKLEHKEGYVSCLASDPNGKSRWGCGLPGWPNRIMTVVTDDKNQILFPSDFPNHNHNAFDLPGYKGDDSQIVFRNQCKGMYGHRNQELRIWYGEDLSKVTVGDNGGRHCVDVYAMFE